MTKSKKVRPRYQRVEDHPRKRFTPRDGRILHWVCEMRFLIREQIQRLEFDPKSSRYCRDRLRWLFDEGYLDRRRLDLGTGFGANMPVYCLGKKGAGWVALDQKMDPSEVDWKARDNEVELYFMRHTLAINDVRIDLILATRESGYELERWIDERTLKSHEMKDYVDDPSGGGRIAIVPDGYFCIRLPDGRRGCFALELDRGTVKRKSWRRKIRAYVAYGISGKYEKRYGTTSLRVLTIVQAARRAAGEEHEERLIRNRLAKIKQWAEEEERQTRERLTKSSRRAGRRARSFFWFAAGVDITPETILTADVWQVAGREGGHRLIR